MLGFIKNLSSFELIALIGIIALLLLHFAITPFSPPGFFLDEAATGAHVTAMLHQGTNAHGEAWPLFSASLGGGYTTPTYLYPLVGWAAIFEASELSLRYFSVVATCVAILLLALAMRYWLGKKASLVLAITALAMPWGWLQGSLAWDPAIVPLFVTASFLFFSIALFSTNKKARIASLALLPVSLVGLAYTYPPCRITAPLLFVLFYTVLYLRKKISIKSMAASSLFAAIIAIPLAFFMLQPDALERSKALSVFSNAPFFEALGRLSINFVLLLNPLFLFITGDPNIRHSTGIQGMLGLAALPAVTALCYYGFKKRGLFTPLQNSLHLLVLIATIGTVVGLLGAALTDEGQPHSLRATAAWPFITILVCIGWLLILRYQKKRIIYSLYGIFVICTLWYAADLTFRYPAKAAESFDASVRAKIYGGEVVDYPSLSIRYYKTK